MNFVVVEKRKSSNKEVITILAIEGVEIPQNCHECDSIGISDLVGLICPGTSGSYSFDNRPEGCPLKEVESMHTADETVVRCKDCKHFRLFPGTKRCFRNRGLAEVDSDDFAVGG